MPGGALTFLASDGIFFLRAREHRSSLSRELVLLADGYRLRSVPKLLSFGFPQQACNQHLHLLLRRQKVLALILAFIFAGGFFFAGSREARAAGHDAGGQQSSQAAQPHESAPASPQSVPAAAPTTTVRTAS